MCLETREPPYANTNHAPGRFWSAKTRSNTPRGLGILDADINTLEALLLAAREADVNQEKTRAAAPLTTGESNTSANRIIEAVRNISAKGVLESARDPKLRAQFDASTTARL